MIVVQHLPNGEKIIERLRHFFAVDLHEPVVDPETGKGFSGRPFGLGDLIFMVGKDQVLAPSVNVEGLPQKALAHDGALDVPAGPPFSPGAFPPGLPLLARFPEGKIQRVAFFVIDVHPGARHHLIQVSAGQLSISGEILHGIIDIARNLVGQSPLHQPLNQVDHSANVFRGPGRHRRRDDSQFSHVLVVFTDISLRDFEDADAFGIAFLYDLVVHIGKIFYERHLIPPVAQIPGDDVKDDGRSGMPHMADIIGRNAAGIDADFPWFDGTERFFSPAKGVIQSQSHGTSAMERGIVLSIPRSHRSRK